MNQLKFAFRLFFKHPVFSAVAVVTLALGIGANTAMFTLVNGVLFQPAEFARDERLVALFTSDARIKGGFLDFLLNSRPNFQDYRDHCRSFTGMAANTTVPFTLRAEGEPEQVVGELASGNFFELLAVQPALGRFFLPEEDATPGSHPVVVISHAFWQQRFGGQADVLGRRLKLNQTEYTIIGVAPERFHGFSMLNGVQLWVPTMMWPQALTGFLRDNYDNRRALAWNVAARLKPGVTVDQAMAELNALAARLEEQFPRENEGRRVKVLPLREALIHPALRQIVIVASALLAGVAGLVLLIACANVAGLMLARANSRRREIGIRLAVGAGRWDIVWQLIVESLLLAGAGGVLGTLLAVLVRDYAISFAGVGRGGELLTHAIDWRVLALTGGVSVLAGVLFGLAPALQISRPDLLSALKAEPAVARTAQRRFTLRHLLVSVQITLSLIALVMAGLFVRSLQATQSVDPGIRPEGLAVLDLPLASQGYDAARRIVFFEEAVRRLQEVPGVEGAGFTANRPLNGGGYRTIRIEGAAPELEANGTLAFEESVDESYFAVAGLPILSGRAFAATDHERAPRVAVVNQTMASRYWPAQDPIGRRFRTFNGSNWISVVGLTRDVKVNALGEQPQPAYYVPLKQNPADQVSLLYRSRPGTVTELAVREALRGLDPGLPVLNPASIEEVLAQNTRAQALAGTLLGAFAGLALFLAAIGLYGLMAFSVAQRTRELGIRIALGASRASVSSLVLREGARLAVAGVGVGVPLALVLGRSAQGLLYGVSPFDPPTYGAALLVLPGAALLACWLPARRAAGVDPIVALRQD